MGGQASVWVPRVAVPQNAVRSVLIWGNVVTGRTQVTSGKNSRDDGTDKNKDNQPWNTAVGGWGLL